MTPNNNIEIGLLCTACGALERYKVLPDTHVITLCVITLWTSCIVCGASKRRLVTLPVSYFKEDLPFICLTKEEMVELLI